MSLLQIARKLRTLMGPLWWHVALLFGVSRLGDLANLYAGAFLVPAFVPVGQLGAVRPLLLFAGLVATPIAWLTLPAEKYLGVFSARGESGKARSLLRDVLVAAAVLSLGLTVIPMAFPAAILERLRVEDSWVLVLVSVLGTLTCLRPLLVAATRALKRFDTVAISSLPPPFVRLVALWVLVRYWPLRGFLMAQCLGVAAGLVVLAASLARHSRETGPSVSYRPHVREMLRYALPLLSYDLVTRVQAPVEALVIRQRLPELVSAADYLVQMLAMIPYHLGGAVAMFLLPLMAARFEQGQGAHRLLARSMAVTAMIGIGCASALAVVSPWLFSLRVDWQVALPYASLVGWAALGRTLQMVLNCFLLHEHACRRFTYLRYYIPILLAQTTGLYVLAGWDVAKELVPESLWRTVDAWPRLTLGFVVAWSTAWSAVALLAALLHLGVRTAKRGYRASVTGSR